MKAEQIEAKQGKEKRSNQHQREKQWVGQDCLGVGRNCFESTEAIFESIETTLEPVGIAFESTRTINKAD